MTIQYFDTAVIKDTESAANNMKRVFFEVAPDRLEIIKLPLSANTATMQAACNERLAYLKDRQEKEQQLAYLRQQVADLENELGL
jgi:polyhydroxyalkanoate synthesis regulator phasin